MGADSAGLNLQTLGDALVLRALAANLEWFYLFAVLALGLNSVFIMVSFQQGPVQMDQLVQMMGRLDRPGQTSQTLCRAILYMLLGQLQRTMQMHANATDAY